MAGVSVRVLSTTCGVSTATVSRALAGHASVRAATARRILAAARRLGYVRNELVGKVMAHMRSGRAQRFSGNLAIIHVPGPLQPVLLPAHRRIIAGAKARAAELGFQLYEFSVTDTGFRQAGLVRMLHARGVHGVIFIFTAPTNLMADFPWPDFATIAIDNRSLEPMLHTVSLDHYMTLTRALMRLKARGFRRIGMFLEVYKDERIAHKWSAAFRSFQENHLDGPAIPLLKAARMDEALFVRWYQAHRPDLVIGHVDEAMGWLRRLGVNVPHSTAFFSLNWSARRRPCAGIDVRFELQGSVAAENLITQVHRNERGLPADPQTILVDGRWMDGPSLPRVARGMTGAA